MVNDVEVKKENPIQEKSFAFALETVELYKFLTSKNEYILSKQLLRSGTSIGANVEEATIRARKGDGPTLLEMKTYRYKGHSMSDPASYRTKEEVENYKNQDPIEKVLATIQKNKYASEKDLEAISERVKNMVDESVKFAEDSPYPDPAELYIDVYSEKDYPYIQD